MLYESTSQRMYLGTTFLTDMAQSKRFITMLGTDFTAPGGITAVIRSYRDAGLFTQWPIRFLPTYRRNGVLNKLLTALTALSRFIVWLLRGVIACVHAHVAARGSFWRKSVFLKLALVAGAKTIFHLHDGSFPDWYAKRSKRTQGLVRRMFRDVDRVVVLTETWKDWVRTIEPQARVCVIGNPVTVPVQPSACLPGRILFLGRLRQEKGVLDLLQALAKLREAHPDFVVTCAGDGDLAAIHRYAQDLGIAERVHLPGWVDGAEKEKLLSEASLFVLPSYFEGLPVGVLEAMAYGMPVIATDVGGVRDAIGEDAGVLITPGDIAALAQAIEAVLDNPTLNKKMGLAGRGRVEELFATERVMNRIGDLYATLGVAPRQSDNLRHSGASA
ncbi:glycosyltransferase family 4 protein [Accumulibacter sp.]|uniref:glycosyltransferase family 4 protein n=1 Tax=Accumulibacter sp. TaxID=2053492 RepID=UPI0035AE0DE1